MSAAPKVWFITGVSTGFGREIARAALARGDIVAGTLRQKTQLDAFRALAPGRAHALQMDVTDAAAIGRAVEEAVRAAGRIDVLVNNAGYGQVGVAEEVSDQQTRHLFETNFFGLLKVVQAVLPHMRARHSGHIINISSVAGMIGIPGMALYSASKFALEGLTEALAGEVAPLGIRVTIVEPGGFRTDFAGRSISQPERTVADYAPTPAGKVRAQLAAYGGHEPGDPAKAAAAILNLVDAPSVPLRLALGSDALKMLGARLARVTKDYDTWQAVTRSTDFAG
jgi:NAD(P)-dependent dehydrogenase (short-subunit alcohol dehydrogenase family)